MEILLGSAFARLPTGGTSVDSHHARWRSHNPCRRPQSGRNSYQGARMPEEGHLFEGPGRDHRPGEDRCPRQVLAFATRQLVGSSGRHLQNVPIPVGLHVGGVPLPGPSPCGQSVAGDRLAQEACCDLGYRIAGVLASVGGRRARKGFFDRAALRIPFQVLGFGGGVWGRSSDAVVPTLAVPMGAQAQVASEKSACGPGFLVRSRFGKPPPLPSLLGCFP